MTMGHRNIHFDVFLSGLADQAGWVELGGQFIHGKNNALYDYAKANYLLALVKNNNGNNAPSETRWLTNLPNGDTVGCSFYHPHTPVIL